MTFSEITQKTLRNFCNIIKTSWIFIIGIANINLLYQYLISLMISDSTKMHLAILTYNTIIFPIISILIMYIIREKITP